MSTIGNIIKALFFFLELWREKDKAKAEAKKAIANEIVNAFKQTDKAQRAALLNASIGKLRK